MSRFLPSPSGMGRDTCPIPDGTPLSYYLTMTYYQLIP